MREKLPPKQLELYLGLRPDKESNKLVSEKIMALKDQSGL